MCTFCVKKIVKIIFGTSPCYNNNKIKKNKIKKRKRG